MVIPTLRNHQITHIKRSLNKHKDLPYNFKRSPGNRTLGYVWFSGRVVIKLWDDALKHLVRVTAPRVTNDGVANARE